MSDASRLYEVVFKLIGRYCSHFRREHQVTLAQMVAGILRSSNVQFRKIAQKLRYNGKKSSLADKFRRFVRNKNIKVDVTFLPFVDMILSALSGQEIVLMIDCTKVGGKCICLMLSIYYKGRALPLCWQVFKGKKGHSSSELQLELLKNIFPHLQGKEVILLGDGEFDSNDVIDWLENQLNWRYVCRTATNIKIFDEEEWLSLSELSIPDKEEAFFCQVLFTQEASVGPINIVALWDEEDSRHIFFVTNMETLEEAREWYRLRFTIETLFSDVKGRGFNLDKTRLRHPERVSRLILTVAIAYVFTIGFGIKAVINRTVEKLIRLGDSWYDTYYSLFQIGLMHIDHLLNEYLPFPDAFSLPPPESFHHGSVI